MQKEMPRFTVLECKSCGNKTAFKMEPELALVLFSLTNQMCHNCLERSDKDAKAGGEMDIFSVHQVPPMDC